MHASNPETIYFAG